MKNHEHGRLKSQVDPTATQTELEALLNDRQSFTKTGPRRSNGLAAGEGPFSARFARLPHLFALPATSGPIRE